MRWANRGAWAPRPPPRPPRQERVKRPRIVPVIRRPAGFCPLPCQAVRAGVPEGARPGPFEPPPAPCAPGLGAPPVRAAAVAAATRPPAGGRPGPGKAARGTGASWRAPSAHSPDPPAAREAAAAAGAAWRARGNGPGTPGRATARPGPHQPSLPPRTATGGAKRRPARARLPRAPGRPRAAESRGKGGGGSGSTPRFERTILPKHGEGVQPLSGYCDKQ